MQTNKQRDGNAWERKLILVCIHTHERKSKDVFSASQLQLTLAICFYWAKRCWSFSFAFLVCSFAGHGTAFTILKLFVRLRASHREHCHRMRSAVFNLEKNNHWKKVQLLGISSITIQTPSIYTEGIIQICRHCAFHKDQEDLCMLCVIYVNLRQIR